MTPLSPRTAAVLAAAALALCACQDKSLDAAAQAAHPTPTDPTVATAAREVRTDAIDPATGKARGAETIFVGNVANLTPADGAPMPASSLGDANAMSRTLEGLTPTTPGGESAN